MAIRNIIENDPRVAGNKTNNAIALLFVLLGLDGARLGEESNAPAPADVNHIENVDVTCGRRDSFILTQMRLGVARSQVDATAAVPKDGSGVNQSSSSSSTTSSPAPVRKEFSARSA